MSAAEVLPQLLAGLTLRAGPFHPHAPGGPWLPISPSPWPCLMLLVLEGSVELDCPRSGVHRLGTGALVALRCDRTLLRDAGTVGQPRARLAVGGFSPEWADGRVWWRNDGTLLHTVIPHRPRLQTLAADLLEESRSDAAGAEAVVGCIVMRLFTLLLRDQDALPSTDASVQRLQRAAATLRSSLHRPPTLTALATHAGMGRTAFFAAFKSEYGVAPMVFLTAERMQEAARLLRDTDMAVKAVGLAVGYRSRSTFWSAFRTRFGQDPSSYRNVTRRASSTEAS